MMTVYYYLQLIGYTKHISYMLHECVGLLFVLQNTRPLIVRPSVESLLYEAHRYSEMTNTKIRRQYFNYSLNQMITFNKT